VAEPGFKSRPRLNSEFDSGKSKIGKCLKSERCMEEGMEEGRREGCSQEGMSQNSQGKVQRVPGKKLQEETDHEGRALQVNLLNLVIVPCLY
jgi:hypothetical protein